MLRSILAVIAGIVVSGILVFAVESLGVLVYPPPAELDLTDPEAIRNFAANAPLSARLLVLLAWFIGPLGGGWVAARMAARSPLLHALIVGVVFLIADVYNLITIPGPIWFWIGGLVLPLVAAYLAGRMVERQQVGSTSR